MSGDMQRMSDRMSKEMPERMKDCQKECQKMCRKDFQKRCQKDCQKICQKERQEICKELLCQGAEINLDSDIDVDPDLKRTYEDLRLRVVNDPVGQCVVVELLLRLFVLHILGASPEYVAQPEGVTVGHLVWTSDGVAASLTSLRCLVVLDAATGQLEASGRGSLHGHWEIWGVSLTMQSAIEQLADKPGADGRSRGGDEEAEEEEEEARRRRRR